MESHKADNERIRSIQS